MIMLVFGVVVVALLWVEARAIAWALRQDRLDREQRHALVAVEKQLVSELEEWLSS